MTEVRVTDPKTGGQKGKKPERFDLIPWDGMEEIARVYAFGAEKYEDHNWLKGYAWSLSVGALFRHVVKFTMGETRDKESGLHHLAHAAFHCLALMVFTFRELGTDDRAKCDAIAHEFYEVGSEDEPIDLVPCEPDPFPKAEKVIVFDIESEEYDETDDACGAV